MKTLLAALIALALTSTAAHAQDTALDRVQNLINAGRFTEAGNTLTQWERSNGAESNASSNDRARALLLRGRQLARQDGNEDDVVDAEYDFEKSEGEERDQPVGCEKGVHSLNVIRFL